MQDIHNINSLFIVLNHSSMFHIIQTFLDENHFAEYKYKHTCISNMPTCVVLYHISRKLQF